MARLGISNTTRVIAYDDRAGIYATRLWWILNHYGHTNFSLLDGGWTKWTQEQRPANTTVPAVAPASFSVKPGSVKVATAQDVLAAINNPGIKIIDARTQAEIDGKDLRNIKRGGFIESSIPVYWEDTFDPTTKAFKSAAQIEQLYRSRGIGRSGAIWTTPRSKPSSRGAHTVGRGAPAGPAKLTIARPAPSKGHAPSRRDAGRS
jgi:thiosulfate/3-mercaptopyruvate sulfurtransferase